MAVARQLVPTVVVVLVGSRAVALAGLQTLTQPALLVAVVVLAILVEEAVAQLQVQPTHLVVVVAVAQALQL